MPFSAAKKSSQISFGKNFGSRGAVSSSGLFFAIGLYLSEYRRMSAGHECQHEIQIVLSQVGARYGNRVYLDPS